MNDKKDNQELHELYPRISKYLPLKNWGSSGNIIHASSIKNTPIEAIKYIENISKTNNLNHDFRRDLEFFLFHSNGLIKNFKKKLSTLETSKKYKQDRKKLSQIFEGYVNQDGTPNYEATISALSFSIKGIQKNIRISSDIDDLLIKQINYQLFELWNELEKNDILDFKHKSNVIRKETFTNFFPFYKYCLIELKSTSKIGTCRIIAELICKLGYDLNSNIEQLPEDYLMDIFKRLE